MLTAAFNSTSSSLFFPLSLSSFINTNPTNTQILFLSLSPLSLSFSSSPPFFSSVLRRRGFSAVILQRRRSPTPSMSSAAGTSARDTDIDQLTSGASNRVIHILRILRTALSFLINTLVFSLVYFLFPPRRRSQEAEVRSSQSSKLRRREEEDILRRRALAEEVDMGDGEDNGEFGGDDGDEGQKCRARVRVCRWKTFLFYGVRKNALFCRSWFPVSGEIKGILIIMHGLNEHSGRYTHFAKQLISCKFGVYAMDWIGHGGSDGLHGYVPSLDHVVADTGSFLEKVRSEHPGIPCFLFGHSTGGSVVLKAASHPRIEEMLEGIILTSPALRVKPAHPIVGAIAPIFSLVIPKFQFKGANKRGIPVSRDPAAMLAKYSDPLVYTGPIRVRTGHEILRISSFLMRNLKAVTISFFVLHGTADKVTDPLASEHLYNEAASVYKDIKLYEGFLHDLLFEPEREEVALDIIHWMEKKLGSD